MHMHADAYVHAYTCTQGARVREAFAAADEDGSGGLSLSEFIAALGEAQDGGSHSCMCIYGVVGACMCIALGEAQDGGSHSCMCI